MKKSQRAVAYPSQLILSTKLTAPPVMEAWVGRARLLGQLEHDPGRRVTLICAPAGFGKTTIAVQWLAQHPQPVAWLSLETDDSDPERFLRYLIAALRSVFPGACPELEHLLSAVQLPPPEYLSDVLISELAGLHEPVLLVLEDFHSITSPAVQSLLVRTIQHQPPGFQVVVLTRVDPPWPLGLWRTRKMLKELRAADLRFSLEETRAFFSDFNEKTLSEESMRELQRKTEGWPAGLQLLKLSLAGAGDSERFIRDFSGNDRLVADFLTDEVLARQPPHVLDFLSTTAMLDRFCAPLCDFVRKAIPEGTDSQLMIQQLDRENRFIISLDTERCWYRYHHLFQNLLMGHLNAQMPPEEKERIHGRAGKWFAAQGMVEEALKHLISAGELDAAASLLEEKMHALMDADLSRRALGRWLAMFPGTALSRLPSLLVAQGFQKLFHFDLLGMARLMDQVEALLKDAGATMSEASRHGLECDVDIQRCFVLYWQGDAGKALRHALRALSTVSRKHRYAHALAVIYASASYAATGRLEEGLELLARALEDDMASGRRSAGQLLTAWCAIQSNAGNLDGIQGCAQQMLALHETVPMPDYWYGFAQYFLGAVAYERNFLDAAAKYFDRIPPMRYRVPTRLYHDGLLGLVMIARAKGEFDRANQYLSAAQSSAIEMNDPQSMRMLNWFSTRQTGFSGESTHAPPEMDSRTVEGTSFWLEVPSLIRAEYLLCKSDPDDCEGAFLAIEEGLKGATGCHNNRQTIQFMALKAVALKRCRRLDEALEVLEETLHMARPLGFVRTFVDRGPHMAELLNILLQRLPRAPYIRFLLNAFDDTAVSDAGPILLREKSGSHGDTETRAIDEAIFSLLSNREIDVLLMLSERLANKEIAERLYISPETVKRHISNICRKLNVSGRHQAVAAARMRGLLSAK